MHGELHIDQWLQRAEPDFYTMFVNVWIPFNAWYVREYNDTHDRTCLDQVCSKSNAYRNKIKALLTGSSPESVFFKNEIALLQRELLAHPIPENSPLDFDKVLIVNNSQNVFQKDFDRYQFKWEYITNPQKKFKCIVTHKITLITLATIELTKWDELELQANTDYQSINNETISRKVMEYFKEIKPRICKPIILQPTPSGRKPKNAFTIDETMQLYFENDIDLISKAIVEMIYQLRCMIFHGAINPNIACLPIYEHAYNIQRMLIKELV